MGDIGTDPREYEFEPIEAPISVPEPIRVPSTPQPQKVPVPA
jgi:hypothetical protein